MKREAGDSQRVEDSGAAPATVIECLVLFIKSKLVSPETGHIYKHKELRRAITDEIISYIFISPSLFHTHPFLIREKPWTLKNQIVTKNA